MRLACRREGPDSTGTRDVQRAYDDITEALEETSLGPQHDEKTQMEWMYEDYLSNPQQREVLAAALEEA